MSLTVLEDYHDHHEAESEEQYALREAKQFLFNRGYHIEEVSVFGGDWHWISNKNLKGDAVPTEQLAIISAFVHLAHHPRTIGVL